MKKTKFLIVFFGMILILFGCTMTDLFHTADQYAYLIRVADLAQATIDNDFDVNWEELYRLSETYGVDIAGPTTDFLVAAANVRSAYQQLQVAINQSYQDSQDAKALKQAFKKMEVTE